MNRNRNSIALCLMNLSVLFALTGCAGRTPDAKWAEQRQALTSLNNTFSDAADRKQLTDQQAVEIGTMLQMGTTYLELAKEELPEGGSKFESLLLKAQRVLDLIEAQLAARKKEEVSHGNRTHFGDDQRREGVDRQSAVAGAPPRAERRDHAGATVGDRAGG